MNVRKDVSFVSFKGREIDFSYPVQAYRCLAKKDDVWYSIRQRGRVVAHARTLVILNAKFVVRPGGRKGALREKRRNVHAYVTGRLLKHSSSFKASMKSSLEVKYRFGIQFETKDGRRYVDRADLVFLNRSGCWVVCADTRKTDRQLGAFDDRRKDHRCQS